MPKARKQHMNKFELGDKVIIKPLNLEGVVLGIWISFNGVQYEVRYFHNDAPNQVYFLPFELDIVSDNQMKIGF